MYSRKSFNWIFCFILPENGTKYKMLNRRFFSTYALGTLENANFNYSSCNVTFCLLINIEVIKCAIQGNKAQWEVLI